MDEAQQIGPTRLIVSAAQGGPTARLVVAVTYALAKIGADAHACSAAAAGDPAGSADTRSGTAAATVAVTFPTTTAVKDIADHAAISMALASFGESRVGEDGESGKTAAHQQGRAE
jgi:hypothetical protein